jgi:hypothetical protein
MYEAMEDIVATFDREEVWSLGVVATRDGFAMAEKRLKGTQ